jgi:hypothetical protein
MPKPCWGDPAANPADDPMAFGNAYGYMFSQAEVYIRDLMRLLWEQHVYWTRMAIISLAADSPDLDPTVQRLLRNATDFEMAFKPFYGDSMAHQFGSLIKDHLVIAAQLVKAAKADDNQTAADAEKRWYANADQIVYFLNHINPNWPVENMQKMWYEHLALTKAEAVARLTKNYAQDIAIFDQIEQEALMMANSFTNGIIRQFYV